MMPTSDYEYYIHEQYDSIAIFNFGKQVLGGSEALVFSSKLHELISKKINTVIINLGDVEIINSSGLGMLVSGLTTLKTHGIVLVLTNVPQKVRSLLSMTHLDKVFKIFNDIEEAITNFK